MYMLDVGRCSVGSSASMQPDLMWDDYEGLKWVGTEMGTEE